MLAAAYPEALCSESVSLPSSLLRPHVPVPLPLLTFAFTLGQQSVPLGPPTAGQGTFPTLHSRVFPWMPRPLPRRLQRCSFPFLPFGLRPSPELAAGRRLALFRAATSARGRISGLQTFHYVKASSFACHPGRSHRCVIFPRCSCSRLRKRVTISALSSCEAGSHFFHSYFKLQPLAAGQPWRVLRAEYGSLPSHTSDMLVV